MYLYFVLNKRLRPRLDFKGICFYPRSKHVFISTAILKYATNIPQSRLGLLRDKNSKHEVCSAIIYHILFGCAKFANPVSFFTQTKQLDGRNRTRRFDRGFLDEIIGSHPSPFVTLTHLNSKPVSEIMTQNKARHWRTFICHFLMP